MGVAAVAKGVGTSRFT